VEIAMSAKSNVTAPEERQEQLVDALLQSLRYGDKRKEDKAIIDRLREVFKIPSQAELRSHFIEKVEFSLLFAELLKLVQPFSQMMNDVYGFLAGQRTSARALTHIAIGESVAESLAFDLEAFPSHYHSVIQRLEAYMRIYDLSKLKDRHISPLYVVEGLLGCGHCTDTFYEKRDECRECGPELKARFERIFRQLVEIARIVSGVEGEDDPPRFLYDYLERAQNSFAQGSHWDSPCRGYEAWNQLLDEIERRIAEASEDRLEQYDVDVLVRFFELPFWRERNRLYEVWTLIHFVQLLRGVTFDLNVKDGQWHLMYGDSSEPVILTRGHDFSLEMWYQRKLKNGLKMYEDEPIEPEMLITHQRDGCEPEIVVLIECKERKDFDVREIKTLASFYRDQARPSLSIFCNYYKYSPVSGVQAYGNTELVVICDEFRPGNPANVQVDEHFIRLMNERLGLFLQAVLIDVSGSMSGKDVLGVYKKLDRYLAQLPGSKSLSGIFADRVLIYERDRLVEALQGGVVVGGGTELNIALSELRFELQKSNPGSEVVNFFVVTDAGFSKTDWDWLKEVGRDGSYNITIVTQRGWPGKNDSRRLEELSQLKQINVLYM
jgi:hypothetical protein